jgi:hypothetical protein
MMFLEEERDLEKTVEQVLKHAGNPDSQRTSLRAALRLYYSMGHRNGYDEAMADAKAGRDQRVTAHLN